METPKEKKMNNRKVDKRKQSDIETNTSSNEREWDPERSPSKKTGVDQKLKAIKSVREPNKSQESNS